MEHSARPQIDLPVPDGVLKIVSLLFSNQVTMVWIVPTSWSHSGMRRPGCVISVGICRPANNEGPDRVFRSQAISSLLRLVVAWK
jgi:hypothetical protein